MSSASTGTAGNVATSQSEPSDVLRYEPKSFRPHIFSVLEYLCDLILPADERSGSARDAGVAPLLDYLSSQNDSYFERILGGIIWIDAACKAQFGASFLESDPDHQLAFLGLIAYRENGSRDPGLVPGIEFLAFLRKEILSAFFTSAVGFKDLDYRGNQDIAEFQGCPSLSLFAGDKKI